MKKIAITLGIIVLVGGYYFYKGSINKNINKATHHSKYTSSEYKDNDHSDKYSTVDGVSFNKGYDGNYNRAAVEKANKEYSKVTLNKEFQVDGKRSVEGAVNCTYVRDVDGDTLIFRKQNSEGQAIGKNTSMRFWGIDTPEDVNPKLKKLIEPFSLQSVEYVKSKLKEGSTIKILFNKSKGKYGRDVGTVYYENNGEWYNLNLEEVANGLARIAYLKQNNSTIDTKEYYKAENSAKEQKLNIWSIQGYTTKLGYNLAIFK